MATRSVLTGVLCLLLLAKHTSCLHAESFHPLAPKHQAAPGASILLQRVLLVASGTFSREEHYEVVDSDSQDDDADSDSANGNAEEDDDDDNGDDEGDSKEDGVADEDEADECDLEQADEDL